MNCKRNFLGLKVLATVVVYGLLVQICSCQIVQIEDGLIQGRVMQSRSGVPFNAFLRIPFAEPPVGPLRFRSPVPKQPWNGVLDGTMFGPMCIQQFSGLFGSEDCLQLNVFTKNLPPTSELKPVIAFIHGGGFEGGTALNHRPEYLMDRDLILVTIQYRLGAFGFMALERPDIAGNQGLKDQTLALRWIQSNIHHFGGDPNRVTLGGLSAGSVSVVGHMVSPMSQGLFQNVIAQSGSVASHMRPEFNNIELVKDVATRVNCPTESIDAMVTCLENVSNVNLTRMGLLYNG